MKSGSSNPCLAVRLILTVDCGTHSDNLLFLIDTARVKTNVSHPEHLRRKVVLPVTSRVPTLSTLVAPSGNFCLLVSF